MWQHHICVNRCCRLREDRFLTQSKVMEKCRAKTEIIKVISDQRTKPSRMTRKGADGGCGLMKMRQVLPLWHTGIHHGLSCLSGSFLLLPASPVTSRRRSEGIPVAGQKWLQHNWSALCTWPGENQHECTCACARAYTAMQNTITGKGKCSLQWTSVPPATPGIPPSPCYHRGALQKVELVWLTSSPPVFPDQPFPPLLKGMSRFLLNTHPTPSSGHPAESGDHTPTHVQASSPPLAAVLVFGLFATNPLHKTGDIAVAEQWLKSCTSVWWESAPTNPKNLTECTSTVRVMM